MSKIIPISILILILSACSTHQPKGYIKHVDNRTTIKENSKLFVKVPDGTALMIGKVEATSANVDHSAILYPAVTPVDFFASVITHAAITESIKNDKKNSAQNIADRVTAPYRPYIKDIANQALISKLENIALSRGFKLAHYGDSKADTDFILDITPIYLLNQKQDTLTLRTQFLVYQKKNQYLTGKKRKVFYQNQIEVLSSKISTDSPKEYWLSNNGEVLIQTMRSLLSQTLTLGAMQISANEQANSATNKQNFRYDDGDRIAFERAAIVNNDCKRVVIHTLRGWLKSIPVERLKSQHLCFNSLESRADKSIKE